MCELREADLTSSDASNNVEWPHACEMNRLAIIVQGSDAEEVLR